VADSKYGYEEPKAALGARIAAHAKYSDFNLHEWMNARFMLKSGDKVLDLGCGNGNFTHLFWDSVKPSGIVIGLDKNAGLIEEAQNRYADLPDDRVRFLIHDFDEPFPDLRTSFDWIFAIYSLYYTSDSMRIMQSVRELMVQGTKFVVIGPGPENVKDLTELNTQLTGREPEEEHVGRIERISKEFHPLFGQIFGESQVIYEEVNSKMEFPDWQSFGEYYWSTLLWRQTTEGFSDEKIESLREEVKEGITYPVRIKKQMSCLIGECA